MNAAVPESPFRVDRYLPDNRQLIDGKWVPAANGASIEVLDPSLGTPLGSVPAGAAEDAAAAISSARRATAHWADADPSWRAGTMQRWAALLADQAQVIAEIEAREVGYAVFGSKHLAEAVAFMAGQADKIYGRTLPTKSVDTFSFTQREPLGVCASIVPWNAPTALMLTSVAPALAAGNSMVVKPSEEAPLGCLYLAALALEAGVPPGVLNVVTGYGTEAGQALSGSPDIKHMTFTGSAALPAAAAKTSCRSTSNLAARLRTSCCPTPTWQPRFPRSSTTWCAMPGRFATRAPGSWYTSPLPRRSRKCSWRRCAR